MLRASFCFAVLCYVCYVVVLWFTVCYVTFVVMICCVLLCGCYVMFYVVLRLLLCYVMLRYACYFAVFCYVLVLCLQGGV